MGALTYFFLDSRLEAGGSNPATALALGAFLDGVPEQLVLGLGIAIGGEVGVSLIVAIFVSNLPEAIGSARAMRERGRDARTIIRLWVAVAVVCRSRPWSATRPATPSAVSSRAASTASRRARCS